MIKYNEIEKLHIELSSYCNSSCPTCPRNIDGGVLTPSLSTTSLSLDQFQTIFEKNFLQQIKEINFCGNYGDPITCKDIIEIMKYIARNNSNISTVIHTNGGIRDSSFWKTLGRFSYIMRDFRVIFSIDGLEDTNHLYRIGVKWKKLMANVKDFISVGGKAEWDMLIFQHNQHQIDEARTLSRNLGFIKFIEGEPHGFKYNDTIRVVDSNGKFKRLIYRADRFKKDTEFSNNKFNDIKFDIDQDQINKNNDSMTDAVFDKTHQYYEKFVGYLKNYDDIKIQNCFTKEKKEIYIDSDGGVHPCCYLGHINQKFLSIPELILHKKWISDNIGLDNINAMTRSLKSIIESSYFQMIEDSWILTFENGRNPMCVMKCGIQRPNKLIRIA